MFHYILLCYVLVVCVSDGSSQGVGSGTDGNLRVCVVEGRGSYKRAGKFCPVLDEQRSGVECVIATDRLDCLRRISKGAVDFAVLAPEDLVAARWAAVDVLVTNALKTRRRPFESSVVAVVNRRILPPTPGPLRAVLRNTSVCHQGYGGEDLRRLSDTLAEYLESLVTEPSCDPQLSLSENRLRSLAGYFRRMCRAGPWLPDAQRDAELKAKYPSLCAACASRCGRGDRYWGPGGALTCLTERAGDVTWAQLDDVIGYFGLNQSPPYSVAPGDFAYLCRDGSSQPLTDNAEPCAWLRRRWPAVVAKRKAAAAVSRLVSQISETTLSGDGWHGALAALLETNQGVTLPLQRETAPQDYLAAAAGFQEAYSRHGCEPPRHISLCTTSPLERNKCEWLSEAGNVNGVQPPLQCSSFKGTKEGCLEAIESGEADAFVAESDYFVSAQRDYDITPLLYEMTPIAEHLKTVVAYVKSDSSLTELEDLRGKRAAFPRFDGFAWHSVAQYLAQKNGKDCSKILDQYFGDICAPGIEKYNISQDVVDKYTKICYKDGGNILAGEETALRSLIEGTSDVAFLSLGTYKRFLGNLIQEPWVRNAPKIKALCPEENQQYCFISWANIGHVYASTNVSDFRKHEIINVFTKLDQLFGKYYPFHSAMFAMYGPFNHQSDIIFHNNTRVLATRAVLSTHPFATLPLSFERNFTFDSCQFTYATGRSVIFKSCSISVIILSLVCYFLGN